MVRPSVAKSFRWTVRISSSKLIEEEERLEKKLSLLKVYLGNVKQSLSKYEGQTRNHDRTVVRAPQHMLRVPNQYHESHVKRRFLDAATKQNNSSARLRSDREVFDVICKYHVSVHAVRHSDKSSNNNKIGSEVKRAQIDNSLLSSNRLERRLHALQVPPLPLNTGRCQNSLNQDSLSIWRPKAVLVATIREHGRGAVSKIKVSQDELFFASGGTDGTVKIWRTHDLCDRIVLRSDATHRLEGPIQDLTILKDSHTVSCSARNVVELVRVDEGFRKKAIHRFQVEKNDCVTSMFHNITYSRSVLGYTTQNIGVSSFDVRSRDSPFTLRIPPEFGWTTASYVNDGVSVVAATNDGFVTLWDVRMQLCLKAFKHSSGQQIHHLKTATHLRKLVSEFDSSYTSSCKVLACVDSETSVLDLESGRILLRTCQARAPDVIGTQSFLEEVKLPSRPYRVSIGRIGGRGSSSLMRRVDRRTSDRDDRVQMRSVLSRGEFMVSGDSVGVLRYWDLRSPSRSFNIGEQRQTWYSRTRNTYVCQDKNQSDGTICPRDQYRGVVEPRCGHQDAVCDLAVLTKPSKLLISCGRDGLIKIWR